MLNLLWYSQTRTPPSNLQIAFVRSVTQPRRNSLELSRIFRGTLLSSSIWSLHTRTLVLLRTRCGAWLTPSGDGMMGGGACPPRQNSRPRPREDECNDFSTIIRERHLAGASHGIPEPHLREAPLH